MTLGIGESWLYAAMFLWTALTIIEMVAQLVNIFKRGEVVRSWVLEDAKNDFYDIDVDAAAEQLGEGEEK